MSDDSTGRLFFAVDLDAALRDQVRQEALRLRRGLESASEGRGRRLSWISEENYHLTLKFLGSTPLSLLPAIELAAKRAIQDDAMEFEIGIESAGCFPQVLWLDVSDESRTLSYLARRLDEELEPLGFAGENRDFVAHLTLARLKEGRPFQYRRDLEPLEKNGEPESSLANKTMIREIVLYRSRTLSTGAVYETLRRFPLRTI